MTSFTHTGIKEKIQEFEALAEHDYEVHQKETYHEAKELMERLGKMINGGSADAVSLGLLHGLWCEHRYLQNELIQLLFMLLGNLPEVEGEDARNAFGLKICRVLRETFKDELFWKDPA